MSDEQVPAPELAQDAVKRRRKVRSAWISFVGRIVAQIVGAAATVAFAIVVFHSPSSATTQPPSAVALEPPRVALPAQDGIAVVPFRTAAQQPGHDFIAPGLTQLVAATLVERGQMRVISETSAARYQAAAHSPQAGTPFNARYVVDGTVTIVGTRARVIIAITDLISDTIKCAHTFDGSTDDVLSFETAIAEKVAAEVARVVNESTPSDGAHTNVSSRR